MCSLKLGNPADPNSDVRLVGKMDTERDFYILVGVTTEDMPQVHMKDCVFDFRYAGVINVWMLTGDK